MKSVFKLSAAFAVATAIVSTPALAEKPVELTATQLSAVQSHQYRVPADMAFKSAISTLQALGYMDINASKDAGTISATTEAKAKIIYNILWGFGKKKMTQKASVLVEDNGPNGSIVHLNLLISQTKARGIFGTSFSDGQMVKVAEPYSDFFTSMDAQVKDRSLRAVQTSAAGVAGQPVVEPAAASEVAH